MYDPPGKESKDHMLLCDVANLYTVWVFNSEGIIAPMNVEVKFEIDGFSMFDYDMSLDALVVALDAFASEVDVAAWKLLREIETWCGELSGEDRRALGADKLGLLL